MKSPNMSSIFSSNNSIPLIIFVFIFIGVGMFFLIKKTTEKNKNRQDRHNSNSDNESSSGVILEQKIIQETRNKPNQINNNSSNNESNAPFLDNMSSPFSDEVGLFIKKDNDNGGNSNNNNNKVNINKYATPPLYIPPFVSGSETRCKDRQIKRPKTINNVSSTANSNLVKNSSNASY
jgi:hypothetical protein